MLLMLLFIVHESPYLKLIPYYIKLPMFIYLFIYLFVSKAYSSYSSQCRKLKISMSNGYKISKLVIYFVFR